MANEIFIDDVMQDLYTKLSPEVCELVKGSLSYTLTKYEVNPRKMELTVINQYPELLKTYIATKSIEGLSKNTILSYELILRNFFFTTRLNVEQVQPNDIRAYFYHYKQTHNISNRSLDTMRTIINSFFSWVANEGYISVNPTVNIKPIKYQRIPRGYMSYEDLNKIRATCKNEKEIAIVETFYSTGCRLSELINALLDNLDLNKGELIVIGKGNKTRTVYLNEAAKITLTNYINQRRDKEPWVFVTRGEGNGTAHQYTRASMEKMITRLGQRAQLPYKLFPHLFRHTTATHGLQNGMDITLVQKMLGHSNINTTMIYADVIDNSVKEGHEKAIK